MGGGGSGEVKSWMGGVGGRRMDLCAMGICGESRDV